MRLGEYNLSVVQGLLCPLSESRPTTSLFTYSIPENLQELYLIVFYSLIAFRCCFSVIRGVRDLGPGGGEYVRGKSGRCFPHPWRLSRCVFICPCWPLLTLELRVAEQPGAKDFFGSAGAEILGPMEPEPVPAVQLQEEEPEPTPEPKFEPGPKSLRENLEPRIRSRTVKTGRFRNSVFL